MNERVREIIKMEGNEKYMSNAHAHFIGKQRHNNIIVLYRVFCNEQSQQWQSEMIIAKNKIEREKEKKNCFPVIINLI